MALQKQPVSISFKQGLNTKADKWQIPTGQFSALTNTVFDKSGLLQKRNGYGLLANAPAGAQTLSTLNDGLVVLGNTCQSYSADSGTLTHSGLFQPLQLSTTQVVRRATSQTSCDVAVASNGLACSVWNDSDGSSYYQIIDSMTGQIVVPASVLANSGTNPRAYALGNYFIVLYLATISASSQIQYVAIPISNPSQPLSPAQFSNTAVSLNPALDGVIYADRLYVAFAASDIGGAVRAGFLDSTLNRSPDTVVATVSATDIAVTADASNGAIWVSYFVTDTISAACYNTSLIEILAPTVVTAGLSSGIAQMTSVAQDMILTVIYEVINTYGYSSTRTDYLQSNTITQAGMAGTAITFLRGVGLASRAALADTTNDIVMLATYGGKLQPSYFLIDVKGNVLSRLAYSNGIGYLTRQILPNINVHNNVLRLGYLYADQLIPVNKEQNAAAVNGVYAQYGVNLASFTFGGQTSALEIGGSLHPSGGMLWQYDGVKIREHGFNVWPEDIGFSQATTGGHLIAQQYYYQVTYEWTDASGNIHRSAPSIPLSVVVPAGTSTNAVTLNIPTLRQTYKTDNKVRIVIYRWSVANQVYYQITNTTSVTGANPLVLNDPTTDSITFVDTLADSSIIGNNIIYTTGGVVEDIPAPGAVAMALWQNRLFMIDAEDQNLLWYSKQVIENTPVEMSDLFTLYVAPTTGTQGSTGPSIALAAMDDKLIVFKRDAIYYITGQGPDNTGAGGTFSDAIYITASVGCINPFSVVLTPTGVMFQSDKGLWILGRDLSTTYIGADVEDYTSDALVTSAITVPGTNQVRFTLNNKTAVMYDYYFQLWGNWSNITALSSVINNELHTYLDQYGRIVQETPGAFLDIDIPVLWNFTTGWFNLAGLQGFERFYSINLLGQYKTPHKLQVQLSYDYNPGISQTVMITPDNYNGNYGATPIYGDGNYGGNSYVEKWRVFPERQKCSSFKISIQEVYDPSIGVPAGEGLTLSGMLLMVGIKRGSRTQSAATSAG